MENDPEQISIQLDNGLAIQTTINQILKISCYQLLNSQDYTYLVKMEDEEREVDLHITLTEYINLKELLNQHYQNFITKPVIYKGYIHKEQEQKEKGYTYYYVVKYPHIIYKDN